MRKNAREDAFRILFEQLVNDGDANEKLERYFTAIAEKTDDEDKFYVNKPVGVDNDYIRSVVTGVEVNLQTINEQIEKNLMGWEFDRVSKISIAVLRLAIFEILYMDDIPAQVSANEAVTIAKKYDCPSAGAFVNGVLGKVIGEK